MKNKPSREQNNFQKKLEEIASEKFPKFQNKEVPPIYAVVNSEQKILDIHSLTQAEDIAKKTAGKVWAMLRDGEEVQLLHLIDL